jgi:hypothetical protein
MKTTKYADSPVIVRTKFYKSLHYDDFLEDSKVLSKTMPHTKGLCSHKEPQFRFFAKTETMRLICCDRCHEKVKGHYQTLLRQDRRSKRQNV